MKSYDCCGCTACLAICPKKCIEMKDDEKGFKYPVVNRDLCIDCGACNRVCDRSSVTGEQEVHPKAYGAYTNDTELRHNSSSGGIFSVIAQEVLSKGGIVVGATMAPDCYSVRHICIETVDDLASLRGSKYMQSDMGSTLLQVKAALENKRYVLFSGTPCQVAGLKAFLGKEYSNLLCIDIICHGVPSPKVWKKYCKEIESHSGGKITNVNFRHKRYGWKQFGIVHHRSGKHNRSVIFHSKQQDEFMRLFLKNYTLRPSCYECSHKGINGNSDITIGDFWGVEQICPELYDGKGTSLAIIHTKKGEDIFQNIRHNLTIRETDLDMAISRNSAAIKSVYKPDGYDAFWQDFDTLPIKDLAKKYTPIAFSLRIKLAICMLPIVRRMKLRGGVRVEIERKLTH